MDHRQFLLAGIAAFFTGPVLAAYASISPPAGYAAETVNVGSSATTRSVYRAAAGEVWSLGTVRTNASMAVGGRTVQVPAAMRMAANSPAYLMQRIGLGLGSAALTGGLGVAAILAAPLIVDWLRDNRFTFKDDTKTWWESEPQFTGYWQAQNGAQYSTATQACQAGNPLSHAVIVPGIWYLATCIIDGNQSQGQVRFYGEQTLLEQQVSFNRVNDVMSQVPITDAIANQVPIPWPIEEPVVNPSSDPIPVPEPLRVPIGDPIPVPNSNPPAWRSPAIDIVPSPTLDDPWRADVRPLDVIRDTSTPLPDSETIPTTPPAGQTEEPVTPDLCEKNPDILACQKLDEVDSPDLETVEKPVMLTPLSGWGGDNASCPASRHLAGANVDFSFQPYCNFMTAIRPIVLAVAWLSAAFILLGFRQSE